MRFIKEKVEKKKCDRILRKPYILGDKEGKETVRLEGWGDPGAQENFPMVGEDI